MRSEPLSLNEALAALDVVPVRSNNPRTAAIKLTAREIEVLGHLADGLTASETAAKLFTSRRTVEFHLSNVYLKLGVTGKAAGRLAIRNASAMGLL